MDSKSREMSKSRPSPIINEDGEEQFVVDEIKEEKLEKGVLMYRVHWEGYSSSEDEWKVADEIKDSLSKVIKAWKKKKSATDNLFATPANKKQRKSSSRHSSRSVDRFFESPTRSSKSRTPELRRSGARPSMGFDRHSETPNSSSTDSILRKKAVRPQVYREDIAVKVDPSMTDDTCSVSSSRTDSRQQSVSLEAAERPENCQLLQEMVDKGGIKVLFSDFKYNTHFLVKKSSAMVFVKNADCCKKLEDLQEKDVQWPYLMYEDKNGGKRYLLVKIKGLSSKVVASYPLDGFVRRFPQLGQQFQKVYEHFQTHFKTAEANIERLQKSVDEFDRLWMKIEKLDDAKIAQALPKKYQNVEKSPKEVVDAYLTSIVDVHRELYFNILGKKFGELQSHSACGIGIISDLKKFHKTRDPKFKSIDDIKSWINDFCELYQLPKELKDD